MVQRWVASTSVNFIGGRDGIPRGPGVSQRAPGLAGISSPPSGPPSHSLGIRSPRPLQPAATPSRTHLGSSALDCLATLGRLRAAMGRPERSRPPESHPPARRLRIALLGERVGEGAPQSDWPGGPAAWYRRSSQRRPPWPLAIAEEPVALQKLMRRARQYGSGLSPIRGSLPLQHQFRLQAGEPFACLRQGGASSGHPVAQAFEAVLLGASARGRLDPGRLRSGDQGKGRGCGECRPLHGPAWRWGQCRGRPAEW